MLFLTHLHSLYTWVSAKYCNLVYAKVTVETSNYSFTSIIENSPEESAVKFKCSYPGFIMCFSKTQLPGSNYIYDILFPRVGEYGSWKTGGLWDTELQSSF